VFAIKKQGKFRLADYTWFELVVTAAFIAVVSFGGIGGVLVATAPQSFFGLTTDIVCPRGAEMKYDEWYDGESTQFRAYCENTVAGETHERTLAALGVLMAADFLIIFWVVWLVLILLRAIQKKKRESLPQIPPTP